MDHHRVYVITKLGRCHGDVESPLSDSPHGPQNYTYEAMRASLEGSKKRLKVETIDLVQLHCPLMSVLKDPETWTALRKLRDTDKLISYFGVSIETCEEALYVLESVPDLASIQIIFNAFRFKPLEQVLPLAKQKQVAIIPRVPLASGLLSGKIDKSYLDSIAESDHRKFNSVGQVFDAGETWSGLGHTLDTAMTAVEEMKKLVPEGATLGQLALKWILMFPEVTTVIPGCRNEQQVGSLVIRLLASAQSPFLICSFLPRSLIMLVQPLCHHCPRRRWMRSKASTKSTSRAMSMKNGDHFVYIVIFN